ncbi:hypothetical protein BR93DRAFT_573932 [Coniochaeta sp. PMI_546]|nr:hypothetical protein BR93DRAFT_573932 [Coniochaeta sp. PMI_546]
MRMGYTRLFSQCLPWWHIAVSRHLPLKVKLSPKEATQNSYDRHPPQKTEIRASLSSHRPYIKGKTVIGGLLTIPVFQVTFLHLQRATRTSRSNSLEDQREAIWRLRSLLASFVLLSLSFHAILSQIDFSVVASQM